MRLFASLLKQVWYELVYIVEVQFLKMLDRY